MRNPQFLWYTSLALLVLAAAVIPGMTMGARTVARPLHLGDPAPEWLFAEWVQGDPGRPAGESASGVIVLVFWSTYCSQCREAMPLLSALQSSYGPRGVRVICVGHESREKTEAYLKGFNPPLAQCFAIDSHWFTGEAYLDGFSIMGIPYVFLIDRTGLIVWHGSPFDGELSRRLAQLCPAGR